MADGINLPCNKILNAQQWQPNPQPFLSLRHLYPPLPTNLNSQVSLHCSFRSSSFSSASLCGLTDALVLGGVAGRILKAKVWAAQNKALLVGGGIATTGLIAALVAGAIPLWKKVIQPRLTQMKKDHAAGKKVSKRSVEDVYVDELIADEEFVSFLEELAEHMDLE